MRYLIKGVIHHSSCSPTTSTMSAPMLGAAITSWITVLLFPGFFLMASCNRKSALEFSSQSTYVASKNLKFLAR